MPQGLRIKLARFGFVHKPFFVLTVLPARVARNAGSYLEDVGWWDPNPAGDGNQHMGLKIERIKYWLSSGAQPTPKVLQLLARAGIVPEPPKSKAVPKEDPKSAIKWRSDLQK